MRLSINLAVRERTCFVETVAKTLPNMTRDDTTLLVSVDRDDPKIIERLYDLPRDNRIRWDIRDREDSIGAKWNRVIRSAPADVYLPMVDDAAHVTPGFDQRIIDAARLFPDGIGAVYGYLDCLCFAGVQAVTASFAKKMGGIFPEIFPYWFADHWLDDMAHYIGRIAFADVKIDHHDKTAGKSTIGRRDLRFWAALFDVTALSRQECAKDIILSRDFDEPTWRRQMLIDAFPRIADRSLMFNRATRGDSGGDPDVSGWSETEEVRYQRTKEQGQAIMREAVAARRAKRECAGR